MPNYERLSGSDVEFEVEKRTVDTFLVAFTDTHGRLVGSRLAADYYQGIVATGFAVPSHLLCADGRGEVSTAYDFTRPSTGYPDVLVRPDTETYMRLPWDPATIGVLSDVTTGDGSPVAISPRTILQQQIRRLDQDGYSALVGLEPQFCLTDDSDAEPGSHLASRSARFESTLRTVRRALMEMPIPIEGSFGLPGPGQFELTLRPTDPLRACDQATWAHEALESIAAESGQQVTFAAAPGTRTANAGHVSISVRGARGMTAIGDRSGEQGMSEIGRSFIAGQLQHAAELFLLYAPRVDSYRRFGRDPFTPTTLTWGRDNRTCAIRVDGADAGLRVENRLPGSDADPYLTVAAVIAAGLDGVRRQLRAPAATSGDAHAVPDVPLPASLNEALAAWEESAWVASAFGPEVRAHYATQARAELETATAS